jgi:hypothetical protein
MMLMPTMSGLKRKMLTLSEFSLLISEPVA